MRFPNARQAIAFVNNKMLTTGEIIHTETWQSFDISKNPEARMVEILNTYFSFPMYSSEIWADDIRPNLPWADNHFNERVCGQPINPGVEWRNWPWGSNAESSLNEEGQFNHNYMERYWPKYAGGTFDLIQNHDGDDAEVQQVFNGLPNQGIRGYYGDLNDLVELLYEQPLTRQAYLPIWFPEDTGAHNTGRKPCTLGYHFIVRNGLLHINYYIRSCDFHRHFRDDIYMTLKLAEWVLNELRKRSTDWNKVELGDFTMDITSLHMFVSDFMINYGRMP